jgi:hypothetical protein
MKSTDMPIILGLAVVDGPCEVGFVLVKRGGSAPAGSA